jgi:hypothetical protein
VWLSVAILGPFHGSNREFFPVRGTFFRCSWVTVKRPDGRGDILGAIWRPLPKDGADALFLVCPGCDLPRRYLYGWEAVGRFTNSAAASRWQCRSCARLRYSSEGGYLRPTGLGRLGQLGFMLAAYGNLPRPESWLPYVFASIDDPRLDEIVRQDRH